MPEQHLIFFGLTEKGPRRWRPAILTIDEETHRLSIGYKRGLGKRRSLDLPLESIEHFDVEMQPTPHTGIYQMAVVAVIALLLNTGLERFGLEDTYFDALGSVMLLLVGGAVAFAAGRVIRVPQIVLRRRSEPDEVDGDMQPLSSKQNLMYRMLQNSEGRRLLPADQKAELIRRADDLPDETALALSHAANLMGEYDPAQLRLIGARRGGTVRGTRTLARRLETLFAARQVAYTPLDVQQLDWEGSQRLVTMTHVLAWLVFIGTLVYLLYVILAGLA